jgi:excisionase family DNA binding protein
MRFHEWLTASEAAEYLRLPSVKALYQRAARGQIKKYLLGARVIRFRRRDLDALLRPCGTPATAPVDPNAVCAVVGR